MPARSAAFVLAVALLLGCAHGRSLKQDETAFTYTWRYAPVAANCAEYNGTKGFYGDGTSWWIAAAQPATINWDKVLELVWQVCANPEEASSVMQAAFDKPGSEEALLAVAAVNQRCPDDSDTVGLMYLRPAYASRNVSWLQSLAEKWVAASDAAGYGFCLTFGEFDSNGVLVNGTEQNVHSPTLYNGTGRPDWFYVGGTYSLPSKQQGQPVTCYTWNGKEMVAGKKEWPGTVAAPATVDPTELDAFVNEVCANLSSAAPTLIDAIESGGDGAHLAAMSTLYSCPGDVRLDLVMYRSIWPTTNNDWRRSLDLSKAWVNALDQVGYPMCVTQILYKNEIPANITFVHPGGVTSGSVGATRT